MPGLIVRSLVQVVALLFLFSISVELFAQGDAPTRVVLGTATKGGGFQLFGQNLAEVINSQGQKLHIEAMATRGSKHNLMLLEAGKIDIGQVEGNAARQALEGIGRAREELKVLAVMYPNPGMFVVRADSPYRSIEDLKAKPVVFGTKASGLRILAGDVLDSLGLKSDRDFKPIILDKASDGPRLVLEKKAEALWGAGIGWPGFVKVANAPAGGRFIAPDAQQLKIILSKRPHLKRMSVPAGTYKGQTQVIESVGLWSLILIRPETSEDLAYQLARSMHRGEAALAAKLDQGAYTTVANTVAQIPVAQLHPGVVRYYRELGLLR